MMPARPPGLRINRRTAVALGAGLAWAGRSAATAAAPGLLVVHDDGRAITLFDGERLAPLRQRATPQLLDHPPLFTPDGRQAYLVGRIDRFGGESTGWIGRFELADLSLTAELSLGRAAGPVALAGDGRWLLAGIQDPQQLVLLDRDLVPRRTWPGVSRDGRQGSAAAAVVDAPTRRSFVATLAQVPEMLEISYDPAAEDFYEGLVHDFRMGEGVPMRGYLNARRTRLPLPLAELYFDPRSTELLGCPAPGAADLAPCHVVNLDVRRSIRTLALPGRVQPGGAAVLRRDGQPLLALPNRSRARIEIIEPRTWQPVASVATAGPGRALRAHAGSRFLWADTAFADDAPDRASVIDRESLQLAHVVRHPGARIAAIAFTPDARHVLLLDHGPAGLLYLHDAATLALRATRALDRPRAAWTLPGPA